MMVNFGETEIFERQMTKALDGVVGGKAFFTNLLKELAKGL
jgi:uncharacterized membrane protein YbjE (DUF340 family)